MKTLTILICIISLSALGQTQKRQINYHRVGGGGEIVVVDGAFSGNVVSFRHEWNPPRTMIIRTVVTVRNSGIDKEFVVGAGAKITKNGNLAHLENIRVGDFIGGHTEKDTPIAKAITLTTPQPAPVVMKPKTNAPTSTVSANRPAS